MHGKLYLIPNTLGESQVQYVIPSGVLDIIYTLDHFIVENIRTARRFLIKSGYPKDINKVEFYLYNKHNGKDNIHALIALCKTGLDVGIISEAGVPAVADPGAEIVEYAHKSGIEVIPLTGPSSILLALMASGLNGQSFSFLGYLPVKREELIHKIKEIEFRSVRENQTQIFIETPYRNLRLFEELKKVCKPTTYLCIAVNLTTPEEKITVKTIGEWHHLSPDIDRKPAVFLISGNTLGDVEKLNIKYKG